MTDMTASFWTRVSGRLSEARSVVLSAGDRTLNGPELLAEVERWAGMLAGLGIGKGDRVAVQAGKSLDLVLLYLAALRIGAIYLPLNTGYTDQEITYFVGNADPVLLVRDDAREPLAGVQVRAISDLATFAAGTPPPAPAHDATADDLAAIVYTSGTTGVSKGAMISHGNLLANAEALVATWELAPADRLLHALPLFHIHGLFVALNTMLLAGGRTDLIPEFNPKAVLAGLSQATLFMGVPTYYTRLLAESGLDAESVSGVRAFICGSAPLTPQTFEAFEARTGHRILERYGMSECGIIASNPLRGERIAGSVGRPLPGFDARIANGEAIGVLEVRGPSVFGGYWRMPEKTRQEFRDDGYFVTGDVATIDPHGVIRIVGRDKDMIISGGLNVYPKEIEERINDLPGVVESAVIGLPHADFGEAVAAVVHARSPEDFDGAALIATLRGELAGFKLPKAVFVVPELPRNTMGKVQKAALRARYSSHFSAEGR
ncbi:AMP-binding protein [Sphingomonas sp. HF-S3]|uniref:AMP-binding protein n=1 Tax=Sphingomonas rustica TaxID=3103142 RepID=A0ABV0B841_9SPHN